MYAVTHTVSCCIIVCLFRVISGCIYRRFCALRNEREKGIREVRSLVICHRITSVDRNEMTIYEHN